MASPVRVIGEKKNPPTFPSGGSGGILAVTYSHLAYGQTTIGAERFHFRVRNGIGWFPPAMTARKTVARAADRSRASLSGMWRNVCVALTELRLLGCYMVKPHGQLVLVS
jgi:hypothetical protein